MTTEIPFILRRHLAIATALIFSAALSVCAASSQEQKKPLDPRKDYALIYGTVWDAQNRPAYGVRIKIRRSNEKKSRWELSSDHAGEFAQRVPIGKQDYVIWADVKTPKGVQKPQVTAHVENDERVDVSLHLSK